MRHIFNKRGSNKLANDQFLFWLSVGMISIGTTGIVFSSIYDIQKRGNLTYLMKNFYIPQFLQSEANREILNNKVLYVAGHPTIKRSSYDSIFNLTIPNCIYLRRVSEMYQNHLKNVQRKDSQGRTYTEMEAHYKWSETELDRTRNPAFPKELRSTNFISDDVIINDFSINPSTIYKVLKHKEIKVNLSDSKNFEQIEIQLKRKNNFIQNYHWKIEYNTLYGSQLEKTSFYRVGDIRINYYSLVLNPDNGFSIIGKTNGKDIEEVSLFGSNWTSVLIAKDYVENPKTMIYDYINSVKTKFYYGISISFAFLLFGFNLSSLEDYVNKSIKDSKEMVVTNSDSYKKLRLSFKKNQLFFNFFGILFGLGLYYGTQESNKNSVRDELSRIQSWKELIDLDMNSSLSTSTQLQIQQSEYKRETSSTLINNSSVYLGRKIED